VPEVNTGFLAEDVSRGPTGPGTPHLYVFTPDSPPGQVLSRRIVLPEGHLHLFRAYNMPPGRSIWMNIVSQEFATPLSGQLLDSPLPGRDLYMARMVLGGADKWVLTETRTQMLVNLPGVFRFELENADMLDDELCLEYSAIRCVPDFPAGVVL
jgi:hypothetical protein